MDLRRTIADTGRDPGREYQQRAFIAIVDEGSDEDGEFVGAAATTAAAAAVRRCHGGVRTTATFSTTVLLLRGGIPAAAAAGTRLQQSPKLS